MSVLPPDTGLVEPRSYYSLVSRSHYWTDDEELDEVIRNSVDKLNQLRPLVSRNVLYRVEEELLLQFNHFSLAHEGNVLTIDELRRLTEMLRKRGWKHEENENDKVFQVSNSKNDDVTEAINHILVSQKLKETAKQQDLTESVVLHLHSQMMKGLLHDEKEGLPGTYRKVKVCVGGSTLQREHPDLIPHSMENFFDETLTRREGERIFDYLARVHTEFQYIHPFRDGNGRMGRIIMAVLLFQHGYPLMSLPTELSSLFNHAVGLGVHGLEHRIENGEKQFSRLLAEFLQKLWFQVSGHMKMTLASSCCHLSIEKVV